MVVRENHKIIDEIKVGSTNVSKIEIANNVRRNLSLLIMMSLIVSD
jgi:hypothetical protein